MRLRSKTSALMCQRGCWLNLNASHADAARNGSIKTRFTAMITSRNNSEAVSLDRIFPPWHLDLGAVERDAMREHQLPTRHLNQSITTQTARNSTSRANARGTIHERLGHPVIAHVLETSPAGLCFECLECPKNNSKYGYSRNPLSPSVASHAQKPMAKPSSHIKRTKQHLL